MTSNNAEAEKLKQEANTFFVSKDFSTADALYTKALNICDDNDIRKVLFTNRSATKLSLNQFESAINDADEALKLDPSHVKAYYRKASALEAWNKLGDAYYTWLSAASMCGFDQEVVSKQLRKTRQNWLKVFRLPTCPVTDISDLIQRILLFNDKRERLSTLAHFWNSSTQEERFGYFQALLFIIGGSGDLSETNKDNLNPEIMVEMPMGNYVDMPRERLADWFDFFDTLSTEYRTEVFKQVWSQLSSEEQNDIIRDLRFLFFQSAAIPQAQAVAIGEEIDEEI